MPVSAEAADVATGAGAPPSAPLAAAVEVAGTGEALLAALADPLAAGEALAVVEALAEEAPALAAGLG